MRFVVASAVTVALAVVFVNGCRRRGVECRLPPEPLRAVDLNSIADRRHAAADLAYAHQLAETYAEWAVASQTGDSTHRDSGVLRTRAYNYCEALLTQTIASTHQLTPQELKTVR